MRFKESMQYHLSKADNIFEDIAAISIVASIWLWVKTIFKTLLTGLTYCALMLRSRSAFPQASLSSVGDFIENLANQKAESIRNSMRNAVIGRMVLIAATPVIAAVMLGDALIPLAAAAVFSLAYVAITIPLITLDHAFKSLYKGLFVTRKPSEDNYDEDAYYDEIPSHPNRAAQSSFELPNSKGLTPGFNNTPQPAYLSTQIDSQAPTHNKSVARHGLKSGSSI